MVPPPSAGAAGLRLPPRVAAVVDERRRRLTPAGDGPVLDLDDPAARALVARVVAGHEPAPGPVGGYRTIVSAAQLVRFADLAAALGALAGLLAPDGVVVLVEPTSRPVPGGLLLATAWSRHPAVSGAHVHRDVPAALRTSPLSFCDLERITMPTRIWPLRTFVALTAQLAPAPVGDASTASAGVAGEVRP